MRKWPLPAAGKSTRRCFWYQAEFSRTAGATSREPLCVKRRLRATWRPARVSRELCGSSRQCDHVVASSRARHTPQSAGRRPTLSQLAVGVRAAARGLGKPPTGSRSKSWGVLTPSSLRGESFEQTHCLQHRQQPLRAGVGLMPSPRGRRLTQLGSQTPPPGRSTCAPSWPLHESSGASCGFNFI